MKKLLFVTSLLMVFMIAPMVMADQLTVNRQGGYYTGSGGEFTLSGNDLVKFQPYYANSTKDQGNLDPSIQSFCIETNEYVDMGATYYFKLNTDAVAGGTGGPHPDPLSKGAAYLYSLFSRGTLAGYNYTPGSARATSAGLLQNAIWWLEQEDGIAYDSSNIFMKAAYDQFGGEAGARADNNGTYGVFVLNLWASGSTINKQDMLVAVPEPATMLLLGSGLIGLAGFARRRFKK